MKERERENTNRRTTPASGAFPLSIYTQTKRTEDRKEDVAVKCREKQRAVTAKEKECAGRATAEESERERERKSWWEVDRAMEKVSVRHEALCGFVIDTSIHKFILSSTPLATLLSLPLQKLTLQVKNGSGERKKEKIVFATSRASSDKEKCFSQLSSTAISKNKQWQKTRQRVERFRLKFERINRGSSLNKCGQGLSQTLCAEKWDQRVFGVQCRVDPFFFFASSIIRFLNPRRFRSSRIPTSSPRPFDRRQKNIEKNVKREWHEQMRAKSDDTEDNVGMLKSRESRPGTRWEYRTTHCGISLWFIMRYESFTCRNL